MSEENSSRKGSSTWSICGRENRRRVDRGREMKELIVNADDFGLSSGANRGIIKAWREGILTSASLMVGGKAFTEAVALAGANSGLQVGLHLTLVQGRAVMEHEGLPSITDQQENFTDNPIQAGMRYFFLKP